VSGENWNTTAGGNTAASATTATATTAGPRATTTTAAGATAGPTTVGATDPGKGLLAGRVVIVTGAGRGLGRAHALELARQGACVVVNDLGVALDGSHLTNPMSPAEDVAAEISAARGSAVANHDDVADWEGSERLVQAAIGIFGRLDAVVNNAGVVRDRIFVNATLDEWDAVIRVHLRGHFCVSRHAAAYWRDRAKDNHDVSGRIVNTSSGAGLLGSIGQAGYATAKAGIVGLTLVQAAELGRYGVTANAIAPSARTRMTETVFADAMAAPEAPDAFDEMAPENVSPLVAWLCSAGSGAITGRLFEIAGGRLTLMDGWQRAATIDAGRRLAADEIGQIVDQLVGEAPVPLPVYGT
jgi:NAD(P)-dependent dehydrogenase (short-subunit alcohol dehydrogenase family)